MKTLMCHPNRAASTSSRHRPARVLRFVLLPAVIALLTACAQETRPAPVWNVRYHVVDSRVAVDSVQTAYPAGSPEYQMALYWYIQAFDESLHSTGSDAHLQLKFKDDPVGRAAAAGDAAGRRDAEAFKASRVAPAPRPAG